MIELKGITKRFKDVTAVNNLWLDIKEGDIFGFIGPNGAGKTTTIKILATLLKPDTGVAYICNHNVLTQQDDVKRVLGYMPDFFGVYDDMKVWEYLDFFAAAYKIDRIRRPQIINDVLELTDLTDKKESFVESLSRGMKQRLCLAKTLVHDPKVLLLDEPASGLDPRARIEFRELIKELRRMGKTILVSSHILTELSDFCNTIGIIEKGQLLVAGEVNEIIKQMKGATAVLIKVKGDPEKARDLLIDHEEVMNISIYENELEIEVVSECEDTSFINEILIKNDIKVTSFTEKQMDLEDVFMSITKGEVQ